jgi:predicted ArsR family transcriptional regulator
VKAYNELTEKGEAPWSSPSGLRTRRHELTDIGYVEDSDLRVKTYSGRSAIVWRLTEEGRNA